MFGGLGPWELLIVLAIVLLIFGGKRLPDLARGLGKSISNFKSGLNEEPDEADTDTATTREKEPPQKKQSS